jgi:Tetrapyrrole (Corrin/Porphyrin) Methylases
MRRSSLLQSTTLLVLSLQSAAFVQPRIAGTKRLASRHYFTDPASTPEDAKSVQQKKKDFEVKMVNAWGIPHHSTLEPLGPVTKKLPDQLPNGGRVTLVGSGPGDPELLTLAAHRVLTENPDALVISDRLVSEEILALIPGEIKIARKLPGCQELAQEEIFQWVHEGLKEGRHVIRLKIGDPFVFGRGGEEVLVFRSWGVESKVIPVRRMGLR